MKRNRKHARKESIKSLRICSVIPFDWLEEMNWNIQDELYTNKVRQLTKEEIENLVTKGDL